jgi:hypothetical protein
VEERCKGEESQMGNLEIYHTKKGKTEESPKRGWHASKAIHHQFLWMLFLKKSVLHHQSKNWTKQKQKYCKPKNKKQRTVINIGKGSSRLFMEEDQKSPRTAQAMTIMWLSKVAREKLLMILTINKK